MSPPLLLLRHLLLLATAHSTISHPHSTLSNHDLSLFKRNFLTKLGIPPHQLTSPNRSTPRPPLAHPPANVPPFLWDLYRDLSSPRHPPRNSVVRNFFPDTVSRLAHTPFAEAHPDEHQLLLTFNLSGGLRPDEAMKEAHLHLRRRPDSPHFRLTILESLDLDKGIARILDTLHIPASASSDWLALDVSSAVLRLIARRESCQSQCPSLSLSLLLSLSPAAVGVSSVVVEEGAEGPALVLLGWDRVEGGSVPVATAASPRPRRRKRGLRGGRRRVRMAVCRRWPIYIDFRELNWQDWILAPAGFQAFFCAGRCSYPLVDGQNTTNHAIVQSIIHSVSPTTVPPPCCVPTQLSIVSILYIDIDNRIVIKNYPDMMVQGCGCR